jgi:hypothetical protein
LGKTLYIQDKLHLKQSKNVVRLVENIQTLVAAIFINIEGDFIDKLANRLHGQALVLFHHVQRIHGLSEKGNQNRTRRLRQDVAHSALTWS